MKESPRKELGLSPRAARGAGWGLGMTGLGERMLCEGEGVGRVGHRAVPGPSGQGFSYWGPPYVSACTAFQLKSTLEKYSYEPKIF